MERLTVIGRPTFTEKSDADTIIVGTRNDKASNLPSAVWQNRKTGICRCRFFRNEIAIGCPAERIVGPGVTRVGNRTKGPSAF